MTTPLEDILSPGGEAMPSTEQHVQQETTQPAANGEQSTESTDGRSNEAESRGGGKTVPLEALHAERQEKRLYKQNLAAVEERLGNLQTIVERFQQTPQQPAPKPDWYADPDAAGNASFQQNFQQHALPYIQQVQEQARREAIEHSSRLWADEKYGVDVVNAAFEEAKARENEPAVFAAIQQIKASRNPFGELVKWHQTADPEKFRAKIEAETLAKYGIQPGQQPINGNGAQPAIANGGAAPVMPSNLAGARNVGSRSGPAWGGPTPLTEILGRPSLFKR